MKTHRENRTLAEKQRDIKNALIKANNDDSQAWLSTNQIARQIGMARNGRLKAMLDDMAEKGILQVRKMERAGRWPGYEYSLSEQTRKFYTRPLRINHRKNGKKIESRLLAQWLD